MGMKIGELFVALGFQVDQNKIDNFNIGLETTRNRALKVAAGVTAASLAIFKLSDSAIRYAVVLKNFAVQTGLSVTELEKWRHVAEQNDITGGELIDTIKGIQSAQAEIKLGAGNIRPWQLLGINPNDNPFTILERVRESIKDINPALAASIIGQMGIGQNFLNILKSGNLEFDKLNEKFILTNQEQKNLIKLNRVFKDVIWSVRGLKNRIAAMNVDSLTKIATAMKNVASFTMDVIIRFKNLSDKFSILKKAVVVGTAAIAAYFFPITAGVIAAIAAIDDLYIYLEGGESAIGKFIETFNLQPLIEDIKTLSPMLKTIAGFALDFTTESLTLGLKILEQGIRNFIDTIKLIPETIKKVTDLFDKLKVFKLDDENPIIEKMNDVFENMKTIKFNNELKMRSTTPGKSNITNTINVAVNEAATPAQTAKAVANKLQRQFNDTYFQTPNLGVA